MPDYVLRGAHRDADGRIGPPLFEERITAADAREAVRRANARDHSRDDDRINALWLTDARDTLLWSLRSSDKA